MDAPELKKQGISLSYWVSKDSAAHNYVPTISQSEDEKIRQWVNDNYSLYSDTYKEAAYRDAQQAVLNRKATIEKNAILKKERTERAEKASYMGNNLTLNQQKQIAAAEGAISDAAEIIRQWQEMNWVKIDKSLTDRETVDAFLNANTEMPFAEYVNKFLDVQTWWGDKTIYDNRWLAAKLWLAWKLETARVNTTDKIRAWAWGFAQWASNIMQNTLWAWMEWLGWNIWAWLGELWYWAAKLVWADVWEWTVWDKMKQAKWYWFNKEDWKRAQAEASSEWLFNKWLISENQWAYNVWETLWELASEIALTAPVEWAVGAKIAASSLPWILKFWWQALNTFGWGMLFQLADDAAEWELSWLEKYMETWTLSMLTAGVFNAIGKIARGVKKWGYKLFAPKWQDQTALLTQTPESWARKTNINKWFAKDANAAVTPYTEMADDLSKVADTTYWARVAKWAELEWAEGALRYQWAKATEKYTAKDVVKDLEDAFSKVWGEKAKMPKFTVNWKKLTIDKEWLETLNKITTTQDWQMIRLWDEILDAWENRFVRLDQPINAQQTKLFIDDLKNILKDAGYSKRWWETIRAMKDALNWVDGAEWIVKKFENKLSQESLENLNKAKAASKEAIEMDENLKKVVWVLRNEDMVGKVWAAEKALWGKAQMQQLFKEIYDKYWIDMNNEILSWAYNMSLYDVKKAEEILSTFYPSKPWVMELLLRQITKTWRRKAADTLVEQWITWIEAMWNTSPFGWIAGGEMAAWISARSGWENE